MCSCVWKLNTITSNQNKLGFSTKTLNIREKTLETSSLISYITLLIDEKIENNDAILLYL